MESSKSFIDECLMRLVFGDFQPKASILKPMDIQHDPGQI